MKGEIRSRFQRREAGGFSALSAARKLLKIPRKVINLVFNSQMIVWLERRMVTAYGSSNHFTQSVIFSFWTLLYKIFLLVHTASRFEIYRLEGIPEGQTHPIKVVYFQAGRGIVFIAKQLFGENPYQQEQVGSCGFFQLARRAKEAASNADMVIVERITLLRWTPSTGFWQRIPTWVSMTMEIDPQKAWDEVKKQMRSQHSNIRALKSKGFTYRVSHNSEDFDFFYECMYRPYLAYRYPETGAAENKTHLRGVFDRGFLALISTAEGETVAGVISLRQGEVQFSVAVGVLDANKTWLDLGVLSAIYYYQIKHAHEDGLRRLDFGGVRPFLNDGLYRYKYRWGARPILDYWNPREWLFWIPNESRSARQWIVEHPMVPEWLQTGGQPTPEPEDAQRDTAA